MRLLQAAPNMCYALRLCNVSYLLLHTHDRWIADFWNQPGDFSWDEMRAMLMQSMEAVRAEVCTYTYIYTRFL